jgi:hypothetical protein
MTLIVEDGSGKSDADSYISIADITDYNEKYVGDTDWATLAVDAQERAARNATQYLD